MAMLLRLAVAALTLGSISPIVGQTYDSALFSSLKWKNIGPNRGGRSIASAGSDSRPLEYYFGAVGGGLWKTTDGGETWKPVTDGQIHSSSVGSVAVAPSNPDTVYIGMGETELRGNIMQGDGVYKSTDAGKTWKNIGLENTQAIARVRIHPKNPDIVYVAALGHPYGPNPDRGVFRTRDGGKTWQKILFKNDHAGAVDICLDPKNPNVIFAAIWDAYRTPWSLSSGGPLSGFYKSTDGGDHWTEITRYPGLPTGIIGKIGVSVSAADPKRVYALIEAEDGGLFVSDDSGKTWKKINEERKIRQRAFYYTRIYADPQKRDTLYLLNTSLFRSEDGGKTFKKLKEPHGDNHDLWIASNDDRRMINSNDGGGNVSFNAGETWSEQNFPTAQLYHVTTTKDIPYHVCGAQQDNSTVCVPGENANWFRDPRSPQGSWMYAVAGGESGYIASSPKDPNIFYAGSQGALLTKYDRRTGYTRDIQVYPLFFSGQSAASVKERWQWTFPIVFAPDDPNILYTSSQHVWKTTNDGQSWQSISPDLTRADPKTLGDSGGPITKDQNGPEIYATVFTIAPSLLEKDTIWTGSDDGLAYITRDGGKNWKNITPKDLPEFARISLIEASPHKPATAYLAAKRYQLDDRGPYIFRTDDYGQSWTKIVNGIPANDYVHAVREDPKRAGLLYAGTEHGIYVSFDNGAHWQSLSLDLPDTQVSDLVVEDHDLVIATHGRSFYVLNDIEVLRQLKPGIDSQAAHLFQPRDVWRGVNQASIDYFLKTSSDKVTVDILDGQGALVRSFVGTPEDDKKKEEDTDNEFPRGPKPPPRKAGVNRFTWDLRYPGSTTFEGMILWSGRAEMGPLAPPGDYAVRLTAAGVTQTAKFHLFRDPRLTTVTDEDLKKQFQLASEVRDRLSEADQMVIDIRSIKKQFKERAEKAKDPELNAAAERLETRLSAVEEEVYQVRNRSDQDPLNFPIKLNNMLAALARTIESGDAKPTDQSYAVFKELSDRLAVQKTKLDETLREIAKQKGLETVTPTAK